MATLSALPSRYRVTEQTYSGGQGTVAVYTDSFLQRNVAVKRLHSTEESITLHHELKALSQIHSRHVVELYDVIYGSDGNIAGIIEEFVPGPDLEELSKGKKVNLLSALWQISAGLRDIHGAGKLHRDINPRNIRQDAEGILKIFDFGFTSDVKAAVTMKRRGSHSYAAPELFGIPPVNLTESVDIYAFGVLAWFLALNGTIPPFLGKSTGVSGVSRRSFAEIHSEFSPALVASLDSCLASIPSGRPSAQTLTTLLSKQILYGQHRAQITHAGQITVLCTVGKEARLVVGQDVIIISYTGYDFVVGMCRGDVFVNNTMLQSGSILPGSCVLTFGRIELGAQRTFVPVDMSHPGVIV